MSLLQPAYFVRAVLQDKGRKICLGLILGSVQNLHVEQAKWQWNLCLVIVSSCALHISSGFTQAICHPQRRAPCTPKIKTNTCFCCDLYNCGKWVSRKKKQPFLSWAEWAVVTLFCRCLKGQDKAGAKFWLMTAVIGRELKLWLLPIRTPSQKESEGVYEVY